MASNIKHPYRFVLLRTDSSFDHANAAVNGSLKKRAIQALQQRITDAIVCETTMLTQAHAVYSILRAGSKSWMLRLEGRRTE